MDDYYYAPTIFAAVRAREMGTRLSRFDNHLLGALRTTADDEYSFWNVDQSASPSAIPPFAIHFSNTALHGHALLAADEDGIITILDTRRSLRLQLHAYPLSPDAPPSRFRAHTNAIFDAVWINADRDIATASGDTTARVFDIEHNIRKATCRGASGSVKAVRNLADSAYVLATAARDGSIRIYDIRCPTRSDPFLGYESYNTPLLRIDKAHARPPHPTPTVTTASGRKRRRTDQHAVDGGSVTALVTVPTRSNYFLTAGAADGTIKLWDLRKISSPDHDHLINFAHPGEQRQWEHGMRRRQYGIASLDVDPTGSRLIASGTDSSIYMYDVRDLNLGYSCMLTGHKQTSFYIRAKFSPCGRFVGSGSSDSKVYLWDTLRPSKHARLDPVLMLDGHRGGDAAGVDWCKTEPQKLVSYSDDSTVKLWKKKAGCTAGPVKNGGDDIFMGARRVETRSNAEPVKGRALGTRRLRDSDIRSYFKGVVSGPVRASSSEDTDGSSMPGSPIDSAEPDSPAPPTPPPPTAADRAAGLRVGASRRRQNYARYPEHQFS
ncbi:unnamed protein product [Agarophyton chilense]|eukprot:gb/GEZJ01000510.1/.p1 GENE.gb/GEZJ01000510.1/~~gb/GEZJ01000510.1/.p1  ORF type:complete len:616 (-),score=77.11 gb/GEZJ01000510.1/:403-2049(-)